MMFRFLTVCICLFLAACGGRLPTTSKSVSLTRRHFNKYGKKYETSSFGNKKVTNVEILSIEEIHKHLVAIETFITLDNTEVHKARVTIEKGPFGWRMVAWENLGGG